MQESPQLAGKRIAVLAADGFEQAELEQPVAALKEAGARHEIVALRKGLIRGMQVHQSGDLLKVDKLVDAARAEDYDGLLVPGGYISPDLLRQSGPARELVRGFATAGKPVAVLSQAALVLASSGLAQGRVLTCWPGVRDDMVHAGATWLNQPTVRDGPYLFGRGPQDIAAFVGAMLALFAGEAAPAAQVPEATSDPPQDAPAEMPGQPLRWLSAPSFGAMLSLALLGVGVVAANRGRRKRLAGDASPASEESEAKPGSQPKL